MLSIAFMVEKRNYGSLRVEQFADAIAYQVVNGLHVQLFGKGLLHTIYYGKLFALLYQFGRFFSQLSFQFRNAEGVFYHM
jgi:hypothetical protein